MTILHDDNVEINSGVDEIQLTVEGAGTPQTADLQRWQDSDDTVRAKITGDGRFVTGDLDTTPDALIEAHRDDVSSNPSRGVNSLGRFSGTLSTAIAWLVGELVLMGSATISNLHTAIRGRLTHSGTGDSSNAEVRAGDFEVINEGGSSSTPLGVAVGVQGTVANQQDDNNQHGFLSKASGVVGRIHNALNADIETAVGLEVAAPVNDGTIDTLIGLDIPDMDEGTANYAIRTGAGVIHLGDVIDIIEQTADPANKGGVVQFYAKGGKLYAKAPDPDNTVYDLTQSGGSSSVMTGATPLVDGASGLVPQPIASDDTKYLKGDGTWDAIIVVGALDDLSDVDTIGASNGDVLGFDGTDWSPVANSGSGSHTHTLSEITDAGSIASQDSNNVYLTGGDLNGVDINNANFIGGTDIDVNYIKTAEFESKRETWSTDNHFVADDSAHHTVNILKARGSLTSPSSVNAYQVLGRFATKGYDGTDYEDGPYIQGMTESAWTATDNEARLDFYVSRDSDTVLAARLESTAALALKDIGSGVSVSAQSDYAKLWSDAGELKVVDQAGNTTTLSSHNPQMVDPTGRPTSYVHSEKNPFTGKHIEMDIFRALQLLEQLTGETLLHMQDLPLDERMDWANNEARQASEREIERQRWQELPEDRRKPIQPAPYITRPEPQFLKTARNWSREQ